MTTPYPTYPRLHTLLGDALPDLQLPNATAEALEDALAEADEAAPTPAFFKRLRDVTRCHAADGEPWTELRITPARARARDLACTTRCLLALSALGGVLLATQAARELDDAEAQCPPLSEEGLLHAVQLLADHAGALLGRSPL
ncbi:hypothetical protein [Stenotrophomonas indicatrix]|uniref:hypothetical protein n=1 Tax=Stenotrophomonas indicatrix TaxID=2045451 RepID=UPI003207DFB7